MTTRANFSGCALAVLAAFKAVPGLADAALTPPLSADAEPQLPYSQSFTVYPALLGWT